MPWLIIILVIICLDQVSKYFIVKSVVDGNMIPVINKFFYITYSRNKGAAWGIMQNGRMFFIILTIVIGVILAVMLVKNTDKTLRLSLAFILGGAAGNFVDRVRVGSVVDFLNFFIGSYNFPTFNLADSFVVVGTIILAYYVLFLNKDEKIVNTN